MKIFTGMDRMKAAGWMIFFCIGLPILLSYLSVLWNKRR